MKTTSVTGTIGTEPAELIWQDGKVTGSPMALGLLLAARGEQYADPQWPGVADVDVTRHLDFVVTAIFDP